MNLSLFSNKLQASWSMELLNGKTELYNHRCKKFSSPEMCPNTWVFKDRNNKWKIDTELKVECGKTQSIFYSFSALEKVKLKDDKK